MVLIGRGGDCRVTTCLEGPPPPRPTPHPLTLHPPTPALGAREEARGSALTVSLASGLQDLGAPTSSSAGRELPRPRPGTGRSDLLRGGLPKPVPGGASRLHPTPRPPGRGMREPATASRSIQDSLIICPPVALWLRWAQCHLGCLESFQPGRGC